MQKLTFLFTLLFVGTFSYAQQVKEKDLIGTWKLIIDVEEELNQEADEADNYFEEVIIQSISGLLDNVFDNIDIYMEFQKDNDVIIDINAYGEREKETAKWKINNRGYMEIYNFSDDDDNHISIGDDDDEWKMIDGILVSDEHEKNKTVYMTKVD